MPASSSQFAMSTPRYLVADTGSNIHSNLTEGKDRRCIDFRVFAVQRRDEAGSVVAFDKHHVKPSIIGTRSPTPIGSQGVPEFDYTIERQVLEGESSCLYDSYRFKLLL